MQRFFSSDEVMQMLREVSGGRRPDVVAATHGIYDDSGRRGEPEAAPRPDKIDERLKADKAELLQLAAFVETLCETEHSWVVHRSGWHGAFQALSVTAFAATSGDELYLLWALPVLGLAAAVLSIMSVNAARGVLAELVESRSRLTARINQEFGTNIPRLGIGPRFRSPRIRWTQRPGDALMYLPTLMVLFWFLAIAFVALPSTAADRKREKGSTAALSVHAHDPTQPIPSPTSC